MPLTGYVTIWQYPEHRGAAYWFRTQPDAEHQAQWQWRAADPATDQVAVLDLSTLTVVWTPAFVTAMTLNVPPDQTR